MELKKGFSLIELIVVIGLLSLLLLAISSTVLMSIVSSTRIRTVSAVKNSGNYALGQIQSMLRSSKDITSCDTASSSITFVNPDGASTTLTTVLVSGTYTRIASNSAYLTPTNLNVTSFSLECEPSDTEPTQVNISFDMQNNVATLRTTENPLLHFETSINLRNQ